MWAFVIPTRLKPAGDEMFTGLIEEVGTIVRIERGRNSAKLTIRASTVLEDAKVGDSIAVNGVCLTVTEIDCESLRNTSHKRLANSQKSLESA